MGVLIAWCALDAHWWSAAWTALPLATFATLVIVHDHVIRNRRRFDRAVAFYERGLARLEDRWMDSPDDGARFDERTHAYAPDLDLFGRGSLFQLLCTARTRMGEDTLAAWLCAPATREEINARQAAIRELRPELDLREALALTGDDVRDGFDPDALATWAAAPPLLVSPVARVTAAVLATVAVATAIAWAAGMVPAQAFIVVYGLEGAFAAALRPRVVRVIRGVQRPSRDLTLVAQLLATVESSRFESQRLVAMQKALQIAGAPASRRIAHLHRLMHLLDARKNQLFGPISSVLLWATQLALALEVWRAASGDAVRRWLSTIGEYEALCALASYAYEHPDDPFAEIVDAGPCFDGEGLGHPLIVRQRCVPNDIRLGDALRLLVVSGSNMSGKSTLLRTVGINTVMALAGAPVRARSLRVSRLAVGASIRIQDSLQDGTSHFYAEITRLRQLLDVALQPLPLLFLLDEILSGTNSHDRGIGAAAVVREFLARGAIGLITTHDLALTRLVDGLEGVAANVHFADSLENGTMHFDYRMQPGVVQKSNAVALMRAVGLDV